MPTLDPVDLGFASNEEAEAYDRWFRAKVEAALSDAGPTIPHEEVMAEMRALIERKRRAQAGLEQ